MSSTQRRPLVSAVIPVYNGERFVGDAIRSVLEQSYPSVECVVVDDGSTDSTETVVAGFGSQVRFVRQQNAGVAAARNRGIEASGGDHAAFLDADDVWIADKIERQMELLSRDPGLGLVCTGLRVVDTDLRPLSVMRPPSPEDALTNSLLLSPPVVSVAQTALIPRSVLERVGSFDERLSTSADTDLACRIAMSFPIGCIDEPLVLYRQHEEQMHHNADAMEHDMLIVYEKLLRPGSPYSSLRRRAHASLYLTLGLARLHEDKARGLRDLARSARWHPGAVVGYPIKRMRASAP